MSKRLHVINDMPTRSSSAEQWQLWHKAILTEFGRDRANNLWLEAWEKRGNNQANDEELRAYLQKNGISLDKDWQDATVDFAAGVVGGLGDFIGNIQRNIMIVGILVLVIIAGLLVAVAKNPELLQQAASLTPAGRAGKLAKGLKR